MKALGSGRLTVHLPSVGAALRQAGWNALSQLREEVSFTKGSANEIGRCAVWAGEIENCVHQNHIIRCRPPLPALTPYVSKYLNSPQEMLTMKALSITSSGLYSLGVGKIRSVVLPLPPLAEQRRIVAKVDELMAVCDRLEAQLGVAETEGRRLLESVLHDALAPSA